MRYILAVILILVFTVLPSCKFLKEKGIIGRKERKLAEMIARQDSIRVADSLIRVENRMRAIEEARLDSIRIAEEEKVAWEARNKYNIVVGSFITPEYAKSWAEEYRILGYDPKIIKTGDGRFEMVVAESHDQFAVTAGRLEQFHDTVNIDAWIFVKE